MNIQKVIDRLTAIAKEFGDHLPVRIEYTEYDEVLGSWETRVAEINHVIVEQEAWAERVLLREKPLPPSDTAEDYDRERAQAREYARWLIDNDKVFEEGDDD